jgi:hypothetical protein
MDRRILQKIKKIKKNQGMTNLRRKKYLRRKRSNKMMQLILPTLTVCISM